MRKILASTNCCTSDIDILCPSLLKEELEEIVQFLYVGQVSYENETNIIDDLTQLFGYPEHMDLDIQTETNYADENIDGDDMYEEQDDIQDIGDNQGMYVLVLAFSPGLDTLMLIYGNHK